MVGSSTPPCIYQSLICFESISMLVAVRIRNSTSGLLRHTASTQLRAKMTHSRSSALPPLLSTEQVQAMLDDRASKLKLLDASWYLDKSRNAREEFSKERLPGAAFSTLQRSPTRRQLFRTCCPQSRRSRRQCNTLVSPTTRLSLCMGESIALALRDAGGRSSSSGMKPFTSWMRNYQMKKENRKIESGATVFGGGGDDGSAV
ncbi:hypothetical protein PINS_up023382 [Pythium insidiosum]|nr:hypothetical protein PINS_up023382 [Pythium insidiosum]